MLLVFGYNYWIDFDIYIGQSSRFMNCHIGGDKTQKDASSRRSNEYRSGFVLFISALSK